MARFFRDTVVLDAMGCFTHNIAASQTSSTINVFNVGNTDDEPNEIITLTLSADPNNALPNGVAISSSANTGSYTLIDDDATLVSLTRSGTGSVTEGSTVDLTVSLGRKLITGEVIEVPLSVTNGTTTNADWSLAKKSGAGVALTGTVLKFTGSGTLTSSNVQTAVVTLTAVHDALTSESDETMTVAIADGTAAGQLDQSSLDTNVGGGADRHATNNSVPLTLANNPTAPTTGHTVSVSVSPAEVTEGTTGITTDATVTVSVSPPRATAFQVNVCPSGTASRGTDYSFRHSEGTAVVIHSDGCTDPVFTANQASVTYRIRVTGDTDMEPDETVIVTAKRHVGTFADVKISPTAGSATLTIKTDDGTSTNTAPTVANAIPNRTATAGTAFSYAFPTNTFSDADSDSLNYTAAKSDDTALPSWLTFTAGTRTFSGTPQAANVGTLSVKVTADDGNGGTVSDTFDIVVSAAPSTDSTVSFSSATYSGREDGQPHDHDNDENTPEVPANGKIKVTVTISPPRSTATTLSINDTGGTATSGTDYTAGPYSVTIPANAAMASFEIETEPDKILEASAPQTFTITIGTPPTGVTLGSQSTATVTILDDEYTMSPGATLYSVKEDVGSLVVPINVTGSIREDVLVRYLYRDQTPGTIQAVNGDTTVANADYNGPNVYPRFQTVKAGTTQFESVITIYEDDEDNDNHLVRVTIIPADLPTGQFRNRFDVIIQDNDPVVTIRPVDSEISEGAGAGLAAFRVSRNAAAITPLTVNLKVSETGEHVASTEEGDKTVTISKDDDHAIFSVPITNDLDDESHGQITVAIAPPDNPTAVRPDYHYDEATASARVVVLDDDAGRYDGAPSVSVTALESSVVEGQVANFRVSSSYAPPTADLDVVVSASESTRRYYRVRGGVNVSKTAENPWAACDPDVPNVDHAQCGSLMIVTIPKGQSSVNLDLMTEATTLTEQASTLRVVVIADHEHLTSKGSDYSTGRPDIAQITVTDSSSDSPETPSWRFERVYETDGPGGVVVEGQMVKMRVWRMKADGSEALPAPSPQTVTIDIANSTMTCPGYTSRGTFDYVEANLRRQVSFKHLQSYGEFAFPTEDDSTREDPGCVTATVQGASASRAVVVHVTDNEPPAAAMTGMSATGPKQAWFGGDSDDGGVPSYEVREATVGTISVAVSFSHRQPGDPGFTLHYDVSGTATRGRDYTTPGSVWVPPGRSYAAIPVTVVDDDTEDSGETVILTLRPASEYELVEAQKSITITILNHDPNPAPGPAPFVADAALVAAVTAKADGHFNPDAAARLRKIVKGMTGEDGGYTAAECRKTARGFGVLHVWKPWCDEIARREAHAATAAPPPAPDPDPEVSIAGGDPVSEGGEAGFRVTLDAPAKTALAIAFDVSEADGADVVAAGDEGRKSVTIAAGEREALFAVATVDDDAPGPGGAVRVTLALGSGYRVGSDASASVAVVDDDAAPVRETPTPTAATPAVSPALGAIYEGETLTFTVSGLGAGHASVRLGTSGAAVRDDDGSAGAGADFQLRDASGTVRDADHDHTPSGGTLTFRVKALADGEAEGDEAVTVTLTAPGSTLNTVLGALTVKDGPRPVAGAKLSGTALALDEGGAAGSYTVVLTKAPGSTVTVRAWVADPAVAKVHAAGGAPAESAKLTFTADDWNVAQAVTVTPVDNTALGNAGTKITHSTVNTGGAYAAIDIPDVTVKVADDDRAVAPSLSVADARGHESSRVIRFVVRLSHPATGTVRVSYKTRETSPASARAWQDYMPPGSVGGLTFAPGETRKQVAVRLFNDNHDEDEEHFEFVIYRARGATVADGVAVGTIVNSDPMPAAWLARFGRTVAEQALGGISDRLAAARAPGMQGSLGGQSIAFNPWAAETPGAAAPADGASPGSSLDRSGAQALAGIARQFAGGEDDRFRAGNSGTDNLGAGFGFGEERAGRESTTMTARELLLGSSFSLTGEKNADGGTFALWGRAAHGTFDGEEGTLSLDGEVTTGMLGADYARGRWLLGLALTQSAGEGGYRDTAAHDAPGRPPSQDCAGKTGPLCRGAVREGDGRIESSQTAAIPYAALQASERLKLWGALGFGTGEVTLTPDPGSESGAGGDPLKADTTWTMAAVGARGDLLVPPAEGGPALALVSDALWARTTSEKTRGLAASDSDVTRLRLGLEGSWHVALEGGGNVTPKLEVGARHDGGDAETGFGVELGGGIAWVDPDIGLSLDIAGRTLIAHEAEGLKDRGLSASIAFDPDPASERGLSLSVRQEMGGAAQGGLDALFANDPLEDRTGSEAASRWAAEAAYGFPAFSGRFIGSPHVGFGMSTGARDYSLGWRWTPAANAPDLSFGVRATRSESDTAAPEHRFGFEATARW